MCHWTSSTLNPFYADEVPEVTDELVDRVIRRQGWLDPLAGVVQRTVGKVYAILGAPGAALRSAMHGTRIAGHALHPALTDLPDRRGGIRFRRSLHIAYPD
jgi:hypothetical protein